MGRPGPDESARIALVTGAGRGIGLATARELASAGIHVILAGRDGKACEEAALALKDDGFVASSLVLDVADYDSAAAAALSIGREHGRLDILINNAGVLAPLSPIAASDPRAWASNVMVNLVGPYNVCRAMLDLMRQGGVVVNVGSGAADQPVEALSAYCCSKAGLAMLTRSLAGECTTSGIRVVGFRPGRVDTGMHKALRDARVNALASIDRRTLTPVDLPARAIAFLCGPAGAPFHGMEVDIPSLGRAGFAG